MIHIPCTNEYNINKCTFVTAGLIVPEDVHINGRNLLQDTL